MRIQRLFVPTLLLAGFALTAAGCHGWHKDPEKQIDWFARRIEKKLELRADQQGPYKAIVDQVKAHAKARAQNGHETMKTVKAEFDKEQVDVDKMVALAKAKVRERPTAEELDTFIDQVAAFYRTLDPKQQKTLNELVRDKLDWVD